MVKGARDFCRRVWRSGLAVALMLPLLATTVLAQQNPPNSGIEGFVPNSSLPPVPRMPAAPLLIAAYAFIWVALLVYLWSIWRRLGRVEGELRQLEGSFKK
jgi:CcmD family protein